MIGQAITGKLMAIALGGSLAFSLVASAGAYFKGRADMDTKWTQRDSERIIKEQGAKIEGMRAAFDIELGQEVTRAAAAATKAAEFNAAKDRAAAAETREQQTRRQNNELAKSLKDIQAVAAENGDICGGALIPAGVQNRFAERLESLYRRRYPGADLRAENSGQILDPANAGRFEIAGGPNRE